MYLGKYDLRGGILETRLCWVHSRKIWDNAADLLLCPEYVSLRDNFIRNCRSKQIPIHNAIAFWAHIFEHSTCLSEWDLYTLILSAACNYGDFFQYSITRATPAALAWPDDLDALRVKPSDEMLHLCREQILREIQNNPDLVKGTKNFDQFRRVWNTHLFAAKKYQEWKNGYNDLKITGKEDSCNLEEARHLVHIFCQYIHMLSERANSNSHSNFKKCYEEFLAGKENELFASFQYIDSLLHTYDGLALIAPIYVLGVFQKDTTNIYHDWFSSNRSKKIQLAAFSNAKPKIKGKSDNSTVNREIQLIIYQFLCIFFSQIAHVNYDRELCDYILQTFMPLIGLQYFDVDQEKVCKVVYSDSCINKDEFAKTDAWAHPLLGEIEKRIFFSLYLYPDSIPKISFTNCRNKYEDEWAKDAEKLVDDIFVDEYFRIFVLPNGGVGCPRITENIQEPLADLMDKTIAKSTQPYIQNQLQQPVRSSQKFFWPMKRGFIMHVHRSFMIFIALNCCCSYITIFSLMFSAMENESLPQKSAAMRRNKA